MKYTNNSNSSVAAEVSPNVKQPNSFPVKLYKLLHDNKDSIDWLEHGNAFRVMDMDLFIAKALPRFFKRTY